MRVDGAREKEEEEEEEGKGRGGGGGGEEGEWEDGGGENWGAHAGESHACADWALCQTDDRQVQMAPSRV